MTPTLESIDARLRHIEDVEAIKTTRLKYHWAMNEGIYDGLGDIYTEDAFIDFDGIVAVRGHAEVVDTLARLGSRVDFIKQFPSFHMVEVNGDGATGICYLDARYADKGESIMAAVKYTDKFRRTPQGWKFSEMLVKIYFNVPITRGWAGEGLRTIEPLAPARGASS